MFFWSQVQIESARSFIHCGYCIVFIHRQCVIGKLNGQHVNKVLSMAKLQNAFNLNRNSLICTAYKFRMFSREQKMKIPLTDFSYSILCAGTLVLSFCQRLWLYTFDETRKLVDND